MLGSPDVLVGFACLHFSYSVPGSPTHRRRSLHWLLLDETAILPGLMRLIDRKVCDNRKKAHAHANRTYPEAPAALPPAPVDASPAAQSLQYAAAGSGPGYGNSLLTDMVDELLQEGPSGDRVPGGTRDDPHPLVLADLPTGGSMFGPDPGRPLDAGAAGAGAPREGRAGPERREVVVPQPRTAVPPCTPVRGMLEELAMRTFTTLDSQGSGKVCSTLACSEIPGTGKLGVGTIWKGIILAQQGNK